MVLRCRFRRLATIHTDPRISLTTLPQVNVFGVKQQRILVLDAGDAAKGQGGRLQVSMRINGRTNRAINAERGLPNPILESAGREVEPSWEHRRGLSAWIWIWMCESRAHSAAE